ncbi:uncharacterized protein K452DRAFT_312041 [Aplosporella prunicola CBS 121167]|uniref:DUF4219 domain-containing protein n=1 Tax=Aplosporella prunicola CBS 121167 TaxID=1176127 RepID=A0A6A6B586_9PEZI|nr:uncharacterized protein K452DRAFT_312041 [Aplosporella prunicola CBS 121167]KAF2137911.1 hypothetical protein K452DRAFT_312041 [Aplosporella prunicola CBS 121167]
MNTILEGTANFSEWHNELKAYLEARGLWERVSCAGPARKGWKASKDAEPRRILLSSVDAELVPTELKTTKALHIYQYLCECYGEDEPVQQSINAGYLARLWFDSENETLEAFLRRYTYAIIACERSNYHIEDAHQVNTLLGHIELAYPDTVAAIREEMRGGDMPTLEDIFPELIVESREEEGYYDTTPANHTTNEKEGKTPHPCRCCFIPSHSDENCFPLHPEQCPMPGFEPNQRLAKRYYRLYGEQDVMQEGWEETLAIRSKEAHDAGLEEEAEAMEQSEPGALLLGWKEDLVDFTKDA